MFAELHTLSGEPQESSDLVGVATAPVLSMFKQRRGRLFTIVEPNLPEGGAVCRRLIETIEDEYFKGPSRSVTTALKRAIAAANERLRVENSKAPPDKQLRVGLSCAAMREGDVYIAQVAPANAFILHGGVVKRVFSTYSIVPDTSGNGSNRASDSLGSQLEPEVNFAYSRLEEGDMVVLASGSYWKLMPDRYIMEAARHLDPEMAASELYASYTAHTRRPTISIIVVRMASLPATRQDDGNGRMGESRPAVATAEPRAKPQMRDGRSRTEKVAAGKDGEIDAAPVPSLLGRLKGERPRGSIPLYPPGPPLEPVGKPSVRIRDTRQQQRGQRSGSLRWILRLAVMLLLAAVFVLLANVGMSLWTSWQLGDPTALIQEAQVKRSEAAAATDKSSARTLLAESHRLLLRALRAKDDPSTRAMTDSVLAEIDQIDQAVRIDKATVLVDFSSIVEEKGDVTQLVLDGDSLYVLDEGQDRILKYVLTPDGKGVQDPGNHRVLAKRGDKLDGAVVGDLLSLIWMPAGQLRTSPALFSLESGRSIVAYDPKAGGVFRIEVAESQRWGTVQAIGGFAGGLYLLDTKLKGVFYYPPTKHGYESEPYTIVDSRARVDLSKAVDIALDGNLYVLEGGGTIKRFSREGRPLDFDGELPGGPVKGPRALYASANTRSLYLLDTQGERIVQFSQDGKLQRQFKADGKAVSFRELRDIFVDEASRRLYALAQKSLFVFDMPPSQ